jgi:hypothetical protein
MVPPRSRRWTFQAILRFKVASLHRSKVSLSPRPRREVADLRNHQPREELRMMATVILVSILEGICIYT